MNLKLIYGLLWMLLGVGLTLGITSDVHTVRQTGIVLALIALLARLFFYLRSIQPSRDHFAAYEQPLPVLDLSTPAGSLPSSKENIQGPGNRTPVERLLADDPADKSS